MTARQCYEAILIELNKENAPNILLEDFNYLFNKAINLYINKRYNIYDISQQTTDDLRVLKATALLTPNKCETYGDQSEIGRMMGATYEVTMPSDYLHILNCVCIYDVKKTFKCYNKGDVWRRAATRLTADVYSQILDNFWLRPTYRRPYYYIHNINTSPNVPTNPYGQEITYSLPLDHFDGEDPDNPLDGDKRYNYSEAENGYVETITEYHGEGMAQTATTTKRVFVLGNPGGYGTDAGSISNLMPINTTDAESSLGTDANSRTIVTGIGFPNSVSIGTEPNASLVEKGAGLRYGNVSTVRMEIRYGTDDSLFYLKKVYIDYIKAPQNIRLTLEQLDITEDTSQMLEFPDYVCQEIINELVHIVMENITDQRLQTHPVVSLSIANPAQALAPEAAGQTA